MKTTDGDYRKDLDRFLDGRQRVERDMEAQEQLQQLADRQHTTVEKLERIFNDIDRGLCQLQGKDRPTKAELVAFALKHGKSR